MARSLNVFRFDSNGKIVEQDIQINDEGDLSVVSGLEELRQRTICRLQMFRGEDIFDRTKGLPLQSEILERPFTEGIAANLIVAEILNIPENLSVEDVSVSIVGRRLTFIAARITSIYGVVPVQIG